MSITQVGFKDDRQAALSDCRAGTYFNVDDIPSLKPSQVAGCEVTHSSRKLLSYWKLLS